MKSLFWLISFIFLFSTTVKSSEELSSEDHYSLGKSAYHINKCDIAVLHFQRYLAITELEIDKKESILSAISWCQRYHFKTTSFVGIDPMDSNELIKSKPTISKTE